MESTQPPPGAQPLGGPGRTEVPSLPAPIPGQRSGVGVHICPMCRGCGYVQSPKVVGGDQPGVPDEPADAVPQDGNVCPVDDAGDQPGQTGAGDAQEGPETCCAAQQAMEPGDQQGGAAVPLAAAAGGDMAPVEGPVQAPAPATLLATPARSGAERSPPDLSQVPSPAFLTPGAPGSSGDRGMRRTPAAASPYGPAGRQGRWSRQRGEVRFEELL
jgi:hypothetical protein